MALTNSLICDCGTAKTETPSGLKQCAHCDTGICQKRCPKCQAYNQGVMHRITRANTGTP
jgi:hypothetical protein